MLVCPSLWLRRAELKNGMLLAGLASAQPLGDFPECYLTKTTLHSLDPRVKRCTHNVCTKANFYLVKTLSRVFSRFCFSPSRELNSALLTTLMVTGSIVLGGCRTLSAGLEDRPHDPRARTLMNCKQCHCKAPTPPFAGGFCSRSCFASFHNSRSPKHAPKLRTCTKCSAKYTMTGGHLSKRHCPKCHEEFKSGAWPRSTTLAEVQQRLSVSGKHPSWRNAHVRELNRRWNKHLLAKGCAVCGYTHRVELCHRRAVSSFPLTATLGEVNAETNNVPLCPNHHGEFDDGLITL